MKRKLKTAKPDVFLGGRVAQYCGDVREILRELPSDFYDCVISSPPYWGLRDYGTASWVGGDPACDHRSPTMREGRNENRALLAGSPASNSHQLKRAHRSACGKCGAVKVDAQLGLEPSLAEHIAALVDVFEEVRRVLKPSGTFWLNVGDCYATTPNGRSAEDTKAAGNDDRTFRDKPFSTVGPIDRSKRKAARHGGGNNPAGPIYQPDRETGSRVGKSGNKGNSAADNRGRVVAGGYLKPGDLCMIPNRLAIALQDAGWWVKAENVWGKTNGMPDSSGTYRPSSSHEKIWLLAKSDECQLWRARDTGELSTSPDLTERCALRGDAERDGNRWIRMPFFYDAEAVRQNAAYANSGRTTRTKAELYPKRNGDDGNAASFRAIVDKRLLRNYEPAALSVWPMATDPFPEAHFATFPSELVERCLTAGCPPGGKVLDPFGGAGTTALVATLRGLSATLVELSPDYCRIARARIEAAFMGPEEGKRHMTKTLGKTEVNAGPLFGGATTDG